MPRPLPIHPRGPRRPRPVRQPILIAIPQLAPDYLLDAAAALMRPKPWRRDALLRRTGQQPWTDAAAKLAADTLAAAAARLAVPVDIHCQVEGDYHLAALLPPAATASARAIAWQLSTRLPGLWIAVGKLFARDGRFYRRHHGYHVKLEPARSVRIAPDLRRRLTGPPVSGGNAAGPSAPPQPRARRPA